MEKILSVDERIRRAEELYNRRKMQGGIRVSTNNVNNSTRSTFTLLKKMIIKIIVCAIIYLAFYILKNSGVFFSKNVIEQTQKIMSYDINFSTEYSRIVKIINDKVNKSEVNSDEETIQNEEVTQNNEIKENETIEQEELGIGRWRRY